MKKQLLLLAIQFWVLNISFAQITFQKRLGGSLDDQSFSARQTTDGGYILAGYEKSFSNDTVDVYLIKTDSFGDTIWTKTIGGDSIDIAYDVKQTTDGGYILVGSTCSFGQGATDVYLMKTNSSGDTLWTNTYGGMNEDGGNSVEQTSDGGYIIVGYTNSFGAGYFDLYLLKTDSTGDLLWSKTFGGTSTENGYSVQETSDHGFIIAGFTSLNAGNFDAYLIKTTSIGDTLWTKKYGGSSHDYGNCVKQTTDGGYVLVGYTGSFGAGNSDVYVIKTNSGGDTIWTKTFGGIMADFGNDIQQTTDGGYIIVGTTYSFYGTGNTSDVYLIKTNSVGDTLWSKMFGGVSIDEGHSVQQTSDGGYIISGFTWTFSGNVSYDAYLIKCDANGYSGCYENFPPTIVSLSSSNVVTPHTLVTSPNSITGSTSSEIGSGANVSQMCLDVGVSLLPDNNFFIVYPNPTLGKFRVLNIDSGNWSLHIYTILGECVLSIDKFSSLTEIDLSRQSRGYYICKLQNELQNWQTELIIVE